VFNAANEVAVQAFLAERIGFPAIVDTLREVLDRHAPVALAGLDDALAWDAWGRREAESTLAARAR
jgi:1-deoxy-D-xylulose-5-phosphate reductoisomerase